MFNRFVLNLALGLGMALGVVALASPANAQASRTWVSGVGDDANPCSRTAPCKTFAGAISKTAEDGEINCIDPAGFGAVTITKSITIDCSNTIGGVLSSGTAGIIINITSGTDASKTVRLRGLQINGTQTGTRGIYILAATAVFIENVLVTEIGGGSTAHGIHDVRSTGGTSLFVKDTVVTNNLNVGINVAATVGPNIAVLDNVTVGKNNYGLAVGSGNNVTVKHSTFSNNATAGVVADGGANIFLTGSTVTNNSTGVLTGGTVGLSDNNIGFNNVPITGATTSFGSNRFFGNVLAGTAPTPTAQQ